MMSVRGRNRRTWQATAVCVQLAATLVLSGCANNYQAPVTDQGERLVVTPPLIVTSSTPDSSLRAAGVRPSISNASASSGAAASGQVATIPRSHRVSRGDTLYSIAFQYDLDFRALARANGLNPPYTIFVDQELRLNVTESTASIAEATTGTMPTIGVPVSNNSVARAQGSSTANTGVSRQPLGGSSSITRTPIGETPTSPASTSANSGVPQWQWPHSGRILRAFDAQSKGIDIAGSLGDPVYAASAGDVVYSGRGIQGAGELIILRHGDRYLSAYAHNSAMMVREGDRVEAGQQIAEVGATQSGDGMLHFEIRVDGKSVDPTGLLPRR